MFLTLFTIFTVSVSAQTGFAESQNPLGDFFQVFNDQISWYDGEGLAPFILWILIPALGLFAIFNFVYTKAFEFAEQNFSNNSGISRDGLSDMADSMSKLLAISTSIVTLVFWGGLLGWAMIVAGAGAIVWFAWANAAGLKGTIAPLPFGGDDEDGEGASSDMVESLQNEIGSLQDEIGDLRSRLDDDSSDENPDELLGEIDFEVSELEDIIGKLEGIESDFETTLSSVKDEEDYILREIEDEEKSIQKMQQTVEDTQSVIKALAQVKSQGVNPSEFGYENYGSLAKAFSESADQMSNFEGVLEEEMDIIERAGSVKAELKGLVAEISELEQEVEAVESLSEQLEGEEIQAEKIAKRYNDEADWEKIKEEEEETAAAIEKMEKVLKEKDEIKKQIQAELRELEEIKQENNEEISQIRQILQELNEEEQEIDIIEDEIDSAQSGAGRLNAATRNYVEPALEDLRNTIETLESETSQVLERL
ncbi:DNA repair exonuclease SbcCD ATPase subunit [Candidatus Nanohalobium constans]|uniref:DNA repair exonuclease SbcCD ATPase subunit n=2 Tax=Candidatus Nanohalobium constans TaxID=2565781 RepID=A0A5Q0UGS6_9ARCH|nr:DNA repair exonuclease SbcCD ATPase subunit [Candidatus Nanohalobium constans]